MIHKHSLLSKNTVYSTASVDVSQQPVTEHHHPSQTTNQNLRLLEVKTHTNLVAALVERFALHERGQRQAHSYNALLVVDIIWHSYSECNDSLGNFNCNSKINIPLRIFCWKLKPSWLELFTLACNKHTTA